MSAKGEMYKSAASKARHEKREGAKERMMEYGTKKAMGSKKAAKPRAAARKKKMK